MKSRCPSKRLRPDGASDGKVDGKDGGPRSRYKEVVCKNLKMMNDALPTPYGWEDDAPDGKDGSPRSLASAAPPSSKPAYLVATVPFSTSEIPTSICLREHLGNQK